MTRATKRQTRHTGDLSIVFASVFKFGVFRIIAFRVLVLLAALQIRHFIYFARAFIFSARAFTGSSRELGSRPRGGFLSSVARTVLRYVYAPQEGMSAV